MENSLFAMFAPCISSQAVFNVRQKNYNTPDERKDSLECTLHSQRYTELDLSFAKCTQKV